MNIIMHSQEAFAAHALIENVANVLHILSMRALACPYLATILIQVGTNVGVM